MKYTLKPIEYTKWQEFLRQHSTGSLFHSWEWQDIVEIGFGVKVSRLGIFDGEGILQGLFPLMEKRMSVLKLAGAPLSGTATPHSGPLGTVEMSEVLDALEEYARDNRVDYLELALPTTGEKELLASKQFSVQELKTLDLELPATEQELWGKLEVRCRNAVRKAEKSGVEISEPISLEQWLEPYFALSCGVYLRQGKTPPFNRDYFSALWNKLYPSGNLTVLMASLEGKIIAGGIFPREGCTAYYLDGVSDREYNKVVPNNLVQWTFLQRALEKGVTLYDMVGANIPGIAKFKKSFGSTERSYVYAYRNRTWSARLGRAVYAKYGPKVRKLIRK